MDLRIVGFTNHFIATCKLAVHPAGSHMFKGKNRNIKTRCEICSTLTIKTPERRLTPLKITENLRKTFGFLVFSGVIWRRSGAFIFNFEHTYLFALVFVLLTLS